MSSSYGYGYLTSYGWTGTGTGLRKGAIDRPLAIPPKKNLCGLGKDRDEAFPFWDQSVLFPSPSSIKFTLIHAACSPPRQRRSRSKYRATTRTPMTPRYPSFSSRRPFDSRPRPCPGSRTHSLRPRIPTPPAYHDRHPLQPTTHLWHANLHVRQHHPEPDPQRRTESGCRGPSVAPSHRQARGCKTRSVRAVFQRACTRSGRRAGARGRRRVRFPPGAFVFRVLVVHLHACT